LGSTLGLGLPFEPTVRWAAEEGFDFVEPLLDGPYARGRIADGVVSMRSAPADARTDIVVHLPFAVDPGSPFAPVRDGAVDELVAGMGLAADLGTETVSSISRLTPGIPASPGPRCWRWHRGLRHHRPGPAPRRGVVRRLIRGGRRGLNPAVSG
jgi:sugar phosphate isomerase/epimerase